MACAPCSHPRQIGIICWIGVISLYAAVLILVIAVGVNDRPAIAPAGDYELGWVCALGMPHDLRLTQSLSSTPWATTLTF